MPGRHASHWLENLRELGRSDPHPNVYLEDIVNGSADYAYAPGIDVHLPCGGVVRCKYRAPSVDFRRPYICCVGSAHTFGRWVNRPYPELLRDALGIQTINLGYGGAGPELFLGIPEYLQVIRRARVVILQVMSGRCSSCSLWRVLWGRNGQRLADGKHMFVRDFIADIQGDAELERRYIDETLATYTEEMMALLRAAEAPTVLFWFADREPTERQRRLDPALWTYPHMVDAGTVETLRECATAYAHCVVANTGNYGARVGVQNPPYYPTQEMHAEAARTLAQQLRENGIL